MEQSQESCWMSGELSHDATMQIKRDLMDHDISFVSRPVMGSYRHISRLWYLNPDKAMHTIVIKIANSWNDDSHESNEGNESAEFFTLSMIKGFSKVSCDVFAWMYHQKQQAEIYSDFTLRFAPMLGQSWG
jgi:hypothetical protein